MANPQHSLTWSGVLALGICGLAVPSVAGPAERILSEAGVTGGLIVHVGCGDGRLTAELGGRQTFTVLGLATDAADVDAARTHIQSLERYGRVTAFRFDGQRIPLVDGLANLVVVDRGTMSTDELMRVLAPRGVALTRQGDGWSKAVKPWPSAMDEWTHSLYNASGNAVSGDKLAGPPRHLQWAAGPKWTRHHESMSSFQALVTAKGRIFYIADEAPQVSLFLPSSWRLIARDAFNGKLLWKREISSWVTRLYRYKSGPEQMTRRLVAADRLVFASLGLDQPVTVIDAATGETVRVLDETKACEEILHFNDALYVVASDTPARYQGGHRFSPGNAWTGEKKWLKAIDYDTGRCIWKKETPIAPLSYAVTERGVFYHDGTGIVCLDHRTGGEKWRSEPVLLDDVIPTSNTPTLVVYKDVVMFIGGKDDTHRGGGWYAMRNLRTFTALSADSGKTLWRYRVPPTGFECPKDILVIDDLVWIGAILLGDTPGGKVKPNDGISDGAFTGRDIRTGEVARQFKPPWDVYWFHQRCYRSRATEQYIMPSRTGIEFVDPAKGWVSFNHWVRGACLYGTMPANGMLYQPPHPCGCYMESLLHGFNALAATRPTRPAPVAERLGRGPAYDRMIAAAATTEADWPTFRHDNQRSGHANAAIGIDLTAVWTAPVGKNLTAITVALGNVFVAEKDRHVVHAFDAATGQPAWQFTAGGRVDSPPTIAHGRALFGCRDGYVYCLDAADGQLAWRFRAAPNDRRLMADDQLESVWPLHGSVLVLDGKAYFVAGRSMFLDGGLRFLVLDVKTGRKLTETIMNDIDPTTNEPLQMKIVNRSMPVANPDLLSWDGKRLHMKSQVLDLNGKRPVVDANRNARAQTGEDAHLFAPGGFLDDTAFHRVQMIYGKSFTGGASSNHAAMRFACSGKMLVFDESRAYGFSRLPHLHRWVRGLEFHIYAAKKQNVPSRSGVAAGKGKKRRGPKSLTPSHIHVRDEVKSQLPRITKSLTSSAVNFIWSQHDPGLFARAMALTNDALFVAGPPAIRNEATPDATDRWQGRHGGILCALSREDGSKLAEVKLKAQPVFDGMAIAGDKLYMALQDGTVLCLQARSN